MKAILLSPFTMMAWKHFFCTFHVMFAPFLCHLTEDKKDKPIFKTAMRSPSVWKRHELYSSKTGKAAGLRAAAMQMRR